MASADAVCARLYGRIEANKVFANSDFTRILAQVAAYEQAGAAELARIVPPPSEARLWQTFVANLQRVAKGTALISSAVRYATGPHSDSTIGAVPLLPVVNKEIEAHRALARRAGFKYCSLV